MHSSEWVYLPIILNFQVEKKVEFFFYEMLQYSPKLMLSLKICG